MPRLDLPLTQTSAYQIRIRTESADENGRLLLVGGKLVAILIELLDESHGIERGKWAIEATFGLSPSHNAKNFATAADAAEWVSDEIREPPFVLREPLAELA